MEINNENFKEIFNEHFNTIDETALAVLKGHLLIEQVLNQIIQDFVFHGDIINEAQLTFAKKVLVARSMSVDKNDNNIWNLITAINSLRNEIAHQLDSERRHKKLEKLRNIYSQEAKDSEFEKVWEEHGEIMGIAYSVAMCIGFLSAFHNDIITLKEMLRAFINEH